MASVEALEVEVGEDSITSTVEILRQTQIINQVVIKGTFVLSLVDAVLFLVAEHTFVNCCSFFYLQVTSFSDPLSSSKTTLEWSRCFFQMT